MKIVVDCRMSKKSGIGSFIDGILPYFLKSDNEFLLLGCKDKIDSEKIKIIPCDIDIFSLKETFFFPKKITKIINSYDVYFSPYCNFPNGIKIPKFATIHDVVFLDIPELAGKIGTFIRKIFYKKAIIQSKEIFTVSNFSKERIIKNLNCKKNINVVYSAVPEFFFKNSENVIQKDNSIIFIGNIKKHKGLKTLIEAYIKFSKEIEKTENITPKLVIVGSKEKFRTTDETISEILEKTPKEKIEFTGYISDEELKLKLSSARILVQPSLYEGFGLPPLEALICKTNVILSDIPVFKEIYENFPVTYFKTEDSKDLKEKMIQVWTENKKVTEIPEIYSFKSTAEKILKVLV